MEDYESEDLLPQLTIEEAVETLSGLADLKLDRNLFPIEQEEVPLPEQPLPQRVVEWLDQDPDTKLETVKNTFRVILDYLRGYYQKEYRYLPNQQTTEGIKTIMVLVGEAAKKLDRYASLYPESRLESVSELKEYKKLQEFYLSRIARKVDEGVISRWMAALTKRLLTQEPVAAPKTIRLISTKHVFVDLEAVKKDTEYELFFIRKEDGTRFFSPRIIRNIKLVCDFGGSRGELKQEDPLQSLPVWNDHMANACAAQILQAASPVINQYYNEIKGRMEGELSSLLRRALMALMVCSNSHNVSRDTAIKSCGDYFEDFRNFLREALHSREFEKLVAYPPHKSKTHALALLELTLGLCRALYLHLQSYRAIMPQVDWLIKEAQQHYPHKHPNEGVIGSITDDYTSLVKLLKPHANGPLNKVLKVLDEDFYHAFDPLFHHNHPTQLFHLDLGNRRIAALHLPSPTHQEYIHKVSVTEEFKTFLRSLGSGQPEEKFLLINLQDRTSWREHARCVALEDLQKHKAFTNTLTVVTLPKDTDFYNQLAPYDQDNHADRFIEQFRKQLEDENCGFYFPPEIKQALFPDFIDGTLHAIHRIFFGGRNVLPRERRLDFIEIFYLFLELKLIELIKPRAFSLTCKDGVDVSGTASAELFIFLNLLREDKLTLSEREQLDAILFGIPLMVRERLMIPERFQRLQSAIKEIENAQHSHGRKTFVQLINEAFGPLYQPHSILHSRISV